MIAYCADNNTGDSKANMGAYTPDGCKSLFPELSVFFKNCLGTPTTGIWTLATITRTATKTLGVIV